MARGFGRRGEIDPWAIAELTQRGGGLPGADLSAAIFEQTQAAPERFMESMRAAQEIAARRQAMEQDRQAQQMQQERYLQERRDAANAQAVEMAQFMPAKDVITAVPGADGNLFPMLDTIYKRSKERMEVERSQSLAPAVDRIAALGAAANVGPGGEQPRPGAAQQLAMALAGLQQQYGPDAAKGVAPQITQATMAEIARQRENLRTGKESVELNLSQARGEIPIAVARQEALIPGQVRSAAAQSAASARATARVQREEEAIDLAAAEEALNADPDYQDALARGASPRLARMWAMGSESKAGSYAQQDTLTGRIFEGRDVDRRKAQARAGQVEAVAEMQAAAEIAAEADLGGAFTGDIQKMRRKYTDTASPIYAAFDNAKKQAIQSSVYAFAASTFTDELLKWVETTMPGDADIKWVNGQPSPAMQSRLRALETGLVNDWSTLFTADERSAAKQQARAAFREAVEEKKARLRSELSLNAVPQRRPEFSARGDAIRNGMLRPAAPNVQRRPIPGISEEFSP